jgi:hypothetical protein
VTGDELEELLTDCPILYHMAECGSWPSICSRGLLSTSALLDTYGISGASRLEIETQRRLSSVTLRNHGLASAVVRDQLPMDDKGLQRCLLDGISPSQWYCLLNSKVFFWLTRERLICLLNAGTYRALEHDVLELNAKALVKSYFASVWFCPMNSGCTKPYPHPRGYSTFQRLSNSCFRSSRISRNNTGVSIYGRGAILQLPRATLLMK